MQYIILTSFYLKICKTGEIINFSAKFDSARKYVFIKAFDRISSKKNNLRFC